MLAAAPKQGRVALQRDGDAGAVNLIDAAGKLRDDAVSTRNDETITVKLPPDLPRGHADRQLSRDLRGRASGRGIADCFRSAIADRDKVPDSANSGIDGLIWLARIGVYLGLFAGVGGVFFVGLDRAGAGGCAADHGALIVGLVSAVASLGLQGLDVLELPLSRASSTVGAVADRARAPASDRRC